MSVALLSAAGAACAQDSSEVRRFNVYGPGMRQLSLRRGHACVDAFDAARRWEWTRLPRMVGLSRRAVWRCFGRPERSGSVWRYRFVHGGCSEFDLAIVVTFTAGRVTHAESRWASTGDVCASPWE